MGKLDIIVKTLEDKQAFDIKVIDLENKSSVADYFVLATGNSINQNKKSDRENKSNSRNISGSWG